METSLYGSFNTVSSTVLEETGFLWKKPTAVLKNEVNQFFLLKVMGKSDASSITSFECRSLLDSIQNEYEQKQREDSILSKLQEDLSELIAQRNILAKRKDFNEKYCVLCCSAFNLLFKRKVLCQDCHFWTCRSCSLWDNSSKQWLCNACEKQRVLDAESHSWICSRIKDYFGNFGSAKVLQNFCRLKKLSDSENDSGYGTTNDFMPLMKLLSSNSLNKDLKMADLNLFAEYHLKLVEAIQNLSRALQKALHNLPILDGLTPTTAHAALKGVITALVDECQDLPPLQHKEICESIPNSTSYQYADIFSSYDSLVAAAVINKVVEESQSKFKNSFNSMEELHQVQKGELDKTSSMHPTSTEQGAADGAIEIEASGFGLPVECVQIEEIEEITREYTDSEDDKLSSISKWSNSVQSVEDIPKPPDIELLSGIDLVSEAPTPFPEFGCDLIDNLETENVDITCHPTCVTSWEENWLFKKKKRLPLYSNLKYQLLTFCEEPPCMLIPYPSETGDLTEQDELSSELSESHSAGSLEFSSDSDETKVDLKPGADLPHLTHSKSSNQAPSQPSPVVMSSDRVILDKYNEKCHVKGVLPRNAIKKEENKLSQQKENALDLSGEQTSEKDVEVNTKNVVQVMQESSSYDAMPPRPGTIAEREHQKWLNAVPLKNNPYSAENISKRSNFGKKTLLNEHVSSFEEFERKLSVSSVSSEPALNKLNCGPKSIDTELYKRDYYINQDYVHLGNNYPLNKSAKHTYSFSDDCFDIVSEEALNSFEEKVYVSSGKVFTLENHVKRLEREIKDLSSASDFTKEKPFRPTKVSQEKQESNVSNKTEVEKVKKSRPCMKVHSLTARSLSREFRDLAKLNIPKPMNRTIPVPSYGEDSERESLCSPESAPSSYTVHQADNGHGYTSDESNTSTSSIPSSKRRHISRSILERATYWERRAEQGLLSDASVSEEFPAIDIHPK